MTEETQPSQVENRFREAGTVEDVPTEQLFNDPRNVRHHGARSIQAIAASLQRFGQQKPVVALRNGCVIAGNGTLVAARQIGWPRIRVMWTDLDGQEARAYAIADNRTGEVSSWNRQALRAAVSELPIDAQATLGFSDEELDDLIVGPESPGEFEQVDGRLRTDYACPRCGHEWSGSPKPPKPAADASRAETEAKP